MLTCFFLSRHQFCDHKKGSSGLPCAAESDPAPSPSNNDAPATLSEVRMFANRMVLQGLMQASERHGFEGEGFSYLKSPVWWGGVITCMCELVWWYIGMHQADLFGFSGHWRNRQLCSICLCSGNSRHASGRAQCLDWVCIPSSPFLTLALGSWPTNCRFQCRSRFVLPQGKAGDFGQAGLCHVSAGIGGYRPSCASGQARRANR